MTYDRSLEAYYFGFDPAGAESIDKILRAVCAAGRGYHHTESWADEQDFLDGRSYVGLIQDAASEAAERIKELERLNLNQFKKIVELQEGKRVDTGLLRLQAKRVEQLEQALSDLLPYTDAIICYASTISEHDGNRVAKVLADLAEKVKWAT